MDLLIQKNVSLASFTTFKVGGVSHEFVEIKNILELPLLQKYIAKSKLPFFVLSGGSNVVISDTGFSGLVVYMNVKGKEIISENKKNISIKVMAGEVWDEFVKYSVQNSYWGIENLSHIPGKVGSAPVQNIGAYGAEVSQTIESIDVFDTTSKKFMRLLKDECEFGYRTSIFKKHKNYIITSVTFRLLKNGSPNLLYKDLKESFVGVSNPSIQEIRQKVIEIRNNKFTFPVTAERGNVGSFFKNFEIGKLEAENFFKTVNKKIGKKGEEFLREKSISVSENRVKIPAAAVIDICGLKGYKVGGAYVHEKHALVLVNDGCATAQDVYDLAQYVIEVVKEKSGLVLIVEPEFIGEFDGLAVSHNLA